MTEQTNEDDSLRPLSPEERVFVRSLRPIFDDPEQVKRLKRLLDNEPDITKVSDNFVHLSWGGRFILRVMLWLSSMVAAVAAYNTLKAWAGIK